MKKNQTGNKLDKGGKNPSFKSVLYVGIDIGKDKHCARSITARGVEKSKHMFFKNNKEGFEKIIDQMSKWCKQYNCNEILIGMEPSGSYWKALYNYLRTNGISIKLVPPLYVKRSKEMLDNNRLKSDEKDALLIAKLLEEGKYLNHEEMPDENEGLKQLMHHHEDLDKGIKQWLNRVESIMSIYFPEFHEVMKKVNSVTSLEILDKYPFPVDIISAPFEDIVKIIKEASRGQCGTKDAEKLLEVAKNSIGVEKINESERYKLKDIIDSIKMYRKKLSECDKKIEDLLELTDAYKYIKSIPGIGVKAAGAILGFAGDLEGYKSYKQLFKKAGLNLWSQSSGKKRGVNKISHKGPYILRKYLFMPALYNCKAGSPLYEKYKSLTERGVVKLKAVVAIMCKLLKIVYALVRDKRYFEVEYKMRNKAGRDELPQLREKAA